MEVENLANGKYEGKEAIVIIGAGPAGLSAAYDLVSCGIQPIVFEKSSTVGGISRTENRDGYYFDIGGHRFLSKIDYINRLWQKMLGENLLNVRRLSRIYYKGRFFNYPLVPSNALINLGPIESVLIVLSYLRAQLQFNTEDTTFEQWVSNRFGSRLYKTFFKTYTEKVWGIPCNQIRADWAAQRIKGLSLVAALSNAILRTQKARTLVDQFVYPLQGPGMMWRSFQQAIETGGGQIHFDSEVLEIGSENGRVVGVSFSKNGQPYDIPADHVISSMPINRLVRALHRITPSEVTDAADGLSYRSFLIVNLIVRRKELFKDQWIYVHSPEVLVGRIQNFKNWSAAMVPDPEMSSVGMEYFCNEGDEIWIMPDEQLIALATSELEKLGLAQGREVVNGFVVRQSQAYPVYDEGYKDNLQTIKHFLDGIQNLQTIGRNGMHRYNNMDHSMLTGIFAAKNILGEQHDVWNVNEDEEYLEEYREERAAAALSTEILETAFCRMDKLAFAVAVGAVSGLTVFIATLWLIIKGGEVVGPHLSLLSQYFAGYSVTVKGAFIAFSYTFFWGFLFAWLFAYLRNLLVAYYIYRTKRKAEMFSLNDLFDRL
ncbi:FAD dependent oxidoreductase [delta proteobacterium NaphS2]|nr:FAD dependent oxidoreductase [delta proteobacterium NaphS2]